MSASSLCIFGEVLFDHFPDGRRVPGGAPFNVAWHLQAFGRPPHLISRVGNDTEGNDIRAAMQKWGMDETGVQIDPYRSTGKVTVSFVDGEPSYEIVENCAYDAIQPAAGRMECGLLYHGSLALRNQTSNNALQRLKACLPPCIFVDVNLRSPWWQTAQVRKLLQDAHWVKLNTDELALLSPSAKNALEPKDFLAEYELQGLVLTRGAQGAELITAQGDYFETFPTGDYDVVDTVGAGDAFAAVMILGLVNNWPLELTLQRAQAFASCLVGQRGATVSDPAFYQSFINTWKFDNGISSKHFGDS